MKTIILFILLSITALPQSMLLLLDDNASTPALPTLYAVDLDGATEIMVTDLTTTYNTGIAWTMSFWLKNNLADGRAWSGIQGVSGQYCIYLRNAGTDGIFYRDSANTFNALYTGSAYEGAWHLYTIRATADTTVSLFMDGDSLSSSKTATSIIQLKRFGGINTSLDRTFIGLYGETQIISGALTAAQIKNQYDVTKAGFNFPSSYSGATIYQWYKFSGATDAEMLNDYGTANRDLLGTGVTTADQVILTNGYDD